MTKLAPAAGTARAAVAALGASRPASWPIGYGLRAGLSEDLARRNFSPAHDRCRVLSDVAVMIVDGGEAVADIDLLRHQGGVPGRVASAPTMWRTLAEVTPGRLTRIQTARARVRHHVWARLRGDVPASRVVGADLDDLIDFAHTGVDLLDPWAAGPAAG